MDFSSTAAAAADFGPAFDEWTEDWTDAEDLEDLKEFVNDKREEEEAADPRPGSFAIVSELLLSDDERRLDDEKKIRENWIWMLIHVPFE